MARIVGTTEDDLLQGSSARVTVEEQLLGRFTTTTTDVDDDIEAGPGDDRVFALGGLDTVSAGAGADFVDGGSGIDRLVGGPGDDVLIGGGGNDTRNATLASGLPAGLFGEDGDDRLEGRDGDDSLDGGPGDDLLLGGAGVDELNGGADNDELHGGSGNDDLQGGFGNDVYFGGSGFDDFDWDPRDTDLDTIMDFENEFGGQPGVDRVRVAGVSGERLIEVFGPRIEAGDPGVAFVDVPGPLTGTGMLVIDFHIADVIPGIEEGALTVIGVHALDVNTDIFGVG